jgi:hypothetical protein
MRRLWATAVLAVPLFTLATSNTGLANPPDSRGFGCGGACLKLFSNIHHHGPLYNYGPYYGYYPFKPYGPWDAYLRYDPYHYGDPYAKWGVPQHAHGYRPPAPPAPQGNYYGLNPHLFHGFPVISFPIPSLNLPPLFHKHGCNSCGTAHASWLHGGWFRGHTWAPGTGLNWLHRGGCSSCGTSVAAEPAAPSAVARYNGVGTPAQSAGFYAAVPALDPALDLTPTAAGAR